MATKSSPIPGTQQASGQLNLVFQAPKAPKAAGNIRSPQMDEIIEEMTPPKLTPKRKSERNGKKSSPKRGATAETMAKQQREISVSEFFAKNRHLLGFDNKRKALLTTVKEAIDNSLDACEEGGILPDIDIVVKQDYKPGFGCETKDPVKRPVVESRGLSRDFCGYELLVDTKLTETYEYTRIHPHHALYVINRVHIGGVEARDHGVEAFFLAFAQ